MRQSAAPALSGIAYDANLAWAVTQAANKIPDVQQVHTRVTLEEVGEFDFVIEASDNRFILIEVKASPRVSMAQVAPIIEKAHFYREAYPDRKTALLLVSRYPLSADARTMFMQTLNAACVVFRSRDDDNELIGAITALLSGLRS